MGEDKTESEDVKPGQDPGIPDPADANERADAVDESTDGDGVARFDVARDPGAE